jgi:hypothetical protein
MFRASLLQTDWIQFDPYTHPILQLPLTFTIQNTTFIPNFKPFFGMMHESFQHSDDS